MTILHKKTDIKELSREDLVLWLEKGGFKPYRSRQIFKWLYMQQADSFEEMTDLGKEFRALLSSAFTIDRLKIETTEQSEDGSRKYLFRLSDGKHIETVLIPEKDHSTLCISTQVGCAQGCRFCMTAKGGFIRNLTAGEIIAQVRDVQNDMQTSDTSSFSKLSNIVLMGMGEPLANYSNVIKALSVITDGDYGLKFSHRRVTLSTAGLVNRLPDLGRDSKVNLAISLNASENATRDMLMPVNRKYPIEKLIAACKDYPLSSRGKITFEYILIKGVNDSEEDARRLVKMLRPVRAKFNLIPFNEHEGSDFRRPDEAVIQTFLQILLDNNYTAIVRRSKGRDISAACGQLRANTIKDIA